MNLLKLLGAGLLGAALLPPAAFAGTESGFYAGAGAGQASVGDISVDQGNLAGDINFDGSATGYKIFAGYNFGVIPLLDFAVEGGYVDFGNSDDTVGSVKVETDVTGWDLFGLIGANIGPIGLFAKAGMIRWDGKVSEPGESASDDGTDPAYGIGARFKIGSLEIRAEYEAFDLSVSDLDMISASGVWTF